MGSVIMWLNEKPALVHPAGQIVILAILGFSAISPVAAGTLYMSGGPDLTVYISGTNEFSPGDDISIPVVIENRGLNEYKFVQTSVADRDDLPNTAKLLVITLAAGDAPLTITSGSRLAGDLAGGSRATSIFTATVNPDAPSGTFLLPVYVNYTCLYTAEQYAGDSIRFYYRTANLSLSLPIVISPGFSIDVTAAVPEHLNAGTTGYLNLSIRNTGSENGKNAVVKILRSGDSPIIPADNGIYIGDFPPGSLAAGRYKVSVDPGAERLAYPVDVVVVYENADGDTITSEAETAGVLVGGKNEFTIISPPAEIHAGQKNVITVEYRNSGDTRVFGALGRISTVDPFTSIDDVIYLGDMNSGDSVRASYEVTVDRDATLKEYGLDSEIRFRDALDNTYVSDTMNVRVMVTDQPGFTAIFSDPVLMSIILVIAAGIVFSAFRFRRKAR